jgi:hypothetical protein
MKPKPPSNPPLPPAVPPKFRVIVTENPDTLEVNVNQALAAGQMVEPSTTQMHTVAGVVLLSQACARDPDWEKRVRTRNSTQRIIDNGGIW